MALPASPRQACPWATSRAVPWRGPLQAVIPLQAVVADCPESVECAKEFQRAWLEFGLQGPALRELPGLEGVLPVRVLSSGRAKARLPDGDECLSWVPISPLRASSPALPV